MKIISVSHPRNHSFSVGRTIVNFIAEDIEGQRRSCSVSVDVLDKTKPKVTGCPRDIVRTLTGIGAVITWNEPVFTDNVKIDRIEYPIRKSGEHWTYGQSALLQYRAIDTSGNSVKCTFRVTIKSHTCPTLTGDANTQVQRQPHYPRPTYLVSCLNSRTLFGPYGHGYQYVFCKSGSYYINLNFVDVEIGLRAPDCVDYVGSSQNGLCPAGKKKFTVVDDWWGTKDFYCASCPAGTFYNSSTTLCEKCPLHQYQNEQGKTSCEICPTLSKTTEVGARDVSSCIRQCKPGTFSATGLNETSSPCQPCAKGTYSELDGATECDPCPAGTNTAGTGADSVSDCVSPPNIRLVFPSASVTVKAGSNVSLECYFIASPQPTTTWEKENESLPAGSNPSEIMNMKMEKIGMMLELSKVKVTDSGVYVCKVQNSVGNHSSRISLTVTN